MRSPNYKRENELPAKVVAYNRAAKRGNQLYTQLREIFEPLIGQSVLKKHGTLLAKVEKLLPELESTPEVHIYRNSSDYSLAWCVKACEMVKDAEHCTYQEVTVYVGDLDHGTLTKFYDPPKFREDYNTEDILKKREVFEQKKKELDQARSDLFPFGENDY